MKTQTTIKAIKNNFHTFQCGYCDLQYIMQWTEPQYYNCGVYGWNCDIYTYGSLAITTGYRNMCGKRIQTELIKKYTEKAKEIIETKWTKYEEFEEIKRKLEENRINFFEELKTI